MPSKRDPPNYNIKGGSQFLERRQIPNAVWDGATQLVVVKISDCQNPVFFKCKCMYQNEKNALSGSMSQLAVQQSIDEETDSKTIQNLWVWWLWFWKYLMLCIWCTPPSHHFNSVNALPGLLPLPHQLILTLQFAIPRFILGCKPILLGHQSSSADLLRNAESTTVEGTHNSSKLPRFPMVLGMGPLNWLPYKYLNDPNTRHNNNIFCMNQSSIFDLHLHHEIRIYVIFHLKNG